MSKTSVSKKIVTDDDYDIVYDNRNIIKKIPISISRVKSKKDMNIMKSVITLTFGDMAENHKGMEQIGKMVDVGEGFKLSDFIKIKEKMEKLDRIEGVEIYDLCKLGEIDEKMRDSTMSDGAYIMVIRNGVNAILGDLGEGGDKDEFFDEQASLNVDKKAFMYGRVVNKNARWNLCFDDKGKDPDYENGKGRVIAFSDVPITKRIVDSMEYYFGEKTRDLKGEGNYYYDISKCGIGFHGDGERRKVLAIRLGGSLDIHYQWHKDGEEVGKRIVVPLNGGDIYLMNEKAVGTDWKKKKIYTLRHAAGCDKFTKK